MRTWRPTPAPPPRSPHSPCIDSDPVGAIADGPCYNVSGIGTAKVTVSRKPATCPTGSGISHVDFVSDPQQTTLTVNKVVINNQGGTLGKGAFTLRIDGSPVTNGVANKVTVGTHTVSEVAVAGYAATFSGDCDASGSVILALGDKKTCTITNDDIGPRLTVNKVVINDDGGTAVKGNFTLRIDGNIVANGVQTKLSVGKHVVSEDDPTGLGYNLVTIGGDCAADGNITLALGDKKTCTITNDDKVFKPGDVPLGGVGIFPDVPGAGGSPGTGYGVVAGVLATVAAGAIALGYVAWYARRRLAA